MESQKLTNPHVQRALQKIAVVMPNAHLKRRNVAGLIRQAKMGINTVSIAAKMKVPNQSVSDVILEPRGNISEVLFSSLLRAILIAR